MQLIKPNTKIDFMGYSRVFALVSTALVLISIVLIFFPGPKLGIDFSGGTQIQIPFKRGTDAREIRSALAKLGYGNAEVVEFGNVEGEYLITVQDTTPISDEQENQARSKIARAFSKQGMVEDSFQISSSGDRLQVRFGEEIDIAEFEKVLRGAGLDVREHSETEVQSTSEEEGEPQICDAPVCRLLPLSEFKYEADLVGIGGQVIDGLRRELGAANVGEPERVIYVGPKVGEQITMAGIQSLLYALGFIMLYIAIRFDLRFAPGAIVALVHDALITLGVFIVLRQEISTPFIAAILTIVGYSINDTVVVYDRIRENFQKLRERELSLVINQSINETLARTLLTSMTTLLTVGSIYILGGGMIKSFALAMIIGIVVGTYSSIFIASPLVIYLDRRFFRKQAQG